MWKFDSIVKEKKNGNKKKQLYTCTSEKWQHTHKLEVKTLIMATKQESNENILITNEELDCRQYLI